MTIEFTPLVQMRDKTILAFISGGLDSAYLAYYLLTDPQWSEYRVHLHHVHLMNVERRYVKESQAFDGQLGWLSANCRPFEHSTSILGVPWQRNGNTIRGMMDQDVTAFLGSYFFESMNVAYTAAGRTKSDNRGGLSERLAMNARRMDVVCPNSSKRRLYPIMHLTKRQVYDNCPSELRALTWSCRFGQEEPCNKCPSCKQLAECKAPPIETL